MRWRGPFTHMLCLSHSSAAVRTGVPRRGLNWVLTQLLDGQIMPRTASHTHAHTHKIALKSWRGVCWMYGQIRFLLLALVCSFHGWLHTLGRMEMMLPAHIIHCVLFGRGVTCSVVLLRCDLISVGIAPGRNLCVNTPPQTPSKYYVAENWITIGSTWIDLLDKSMAIFAWGYNSPSCTQYELDAWDYVIAR